MYQFEKNARVCFFGDSITHGGLWLRRIYEHYIDIGVPVELYNCGVAGDNARFAFERMNETLLCHEPTDVVIDFGMNDVTRVRYDGREVTAEVVSLRRNDIDNCVYNIERIAERLASKGIRIIFCTPTPYDEISEGEEKIFYGVEGALHEVGDRIKLVAKKYGSHVVDFNEGMLTVLRKLHKESKTIINPDRVHPNAVGAEIMAKLFLYAQGFDVKMSDDYDELLALSQKPYSEWENQRYELERESKLMEYVKYVSLRSEATPEDRIAIIDKRLQDPSFTGTVRRYFIQYKEKYDKEKDLKQALVSHTKTVYSQIK